MPALPSKSSERLMNAVEAVSTMLGEERSPNEAIIKVAGTHALTDADLEIVVRAVNTGIMSGARLAGSLLKEKSASIRLADIDVIRAKRDDTGLNKAAATLRQVAATSVSDDYDSGTSLLSRARHEQRVHTLMEKTAQAVKPEQAAKPPSFVKATGNVQRSKQAADAARRGAMVAIENVMSLTNDLCEYQRRTDSLPLAVVKQAAVTLHGDFAEDLFKTVVRLSPGIDKLANHRGRNIDVTTVDCRAQPFPLIAQISREVKVATAAIKQAQAEAVRHRVTTESQLSPFYGPREDRSILSGTFMDKEATGLAKEAMGLDMADPMLKALGTYSLLSRTVNPMLDKMKGPDNSSRVNSTLTALNDPQHEQTLRSINARSAITDLMSTDPVISQHDPRQVMQAYNELSQLTPSIADQQMLLRTVLRQQLEQGSLDTHQQGQLLGYDSQLRQQIQPSSGGGSAHAARPA